MRDRIDCPLIPIPTWDEIDRHTDEAYERGIQREIDRNEGYAEKRKIIPPKEQS